MRKASRAALFTRKTQPPDHYAPLFDVDTRHDDILWELWIDGFDTALQLRPGAWAGVRGGDEDVRGALAGLVTLVQIGRGESTLPKEQIDDLTAKAPDLIPHYIETVSYTHLTLPTNREV